MGRDAVEDGLEDLSGNDVPADIIQSVVDFIANRPHEVTRSELPNAGNVVELVYEVSRCPPVFENVQRARQAENLLIPPNYDVYQKSVREEKSLDEIFFHTKWMEGNPICVTFLVKQVAPPSFFIAGVRDNRLWIGPGSLSMGYLMHMNGTANYYGTGMIKQYSVEELIPKEVAAISAPEIRASRDGVAPMKITMVVCEGRM